MGSTGGSWLAQAGASAPLPSPKHSRVQDPAQLPRLLPLTLSFTVFLGEMLDTLPHTEITEVGKSRKELQAPLEYKRTHFLKLLRVVSSASPWGWC